MTDRLVTTDAPGMPPGWSRESVYLDCVLIGYLTCQHYASAGGDATVRYFPSTPSWRTAGDQKAFQDRESALDAINRAHRAARPGGNR